LTDEKTTGYGLSVLLPRRSTTLGGVVVIRRLHGEIKKLGVTAEFFVKIQDQKTHSGYRRVSARFPAHHARRFPKPTPGRNIFVPVAMGSVLYRFYRSINSLRLAVRSESPLLVFIALSFD
jgi:hypothetical protein